MKVGNLGFFVISKEVENTKTVDVVIKVETMFIAEVKDNKEIKNNL